MEASQSLSPKVGNAPISSIGHNTSKSNKVAPNSAMLLVRYVTSAMQ